VLLALGPEVLDQPLDRRELVGLLDFVGAHVSMRPLAGLVVVANEGLAGAPKVQPELDPAGPASGVGRELPYDQLHDQIALPGLVAQQQRGLWHMAY